MRLRLFATLVAAPLIVWLALPLVSSGEPSQRRLEQITDRIAAKREQIDDKRGRERVLSGDVARWTARINLLQDDITALETRQVRLQADLDRQHAELERIQLRLRQERLRLARLRARLVEARRALAVRLVELYKADKPDVVTVILEADGFEDLLQRTEFMQRVSTQDARIITRVKQAKADAVATEARLDELQERERRVALTIERRRDEVAAVKGRLIDRRSSYEDARLVKANALDSTRHQRDHLERDLDELQRESENVAAALRAVAAGSAGTLAAGPIRPGSTGLVWPVNGPIVSPFGPRWGRLHAGVDIAAPAGTPIRASGSGRVVLLGWTGGYGNYTCIQHDDSLSTCYAHQSSYATSMGASVGKGQIIGYVGCTGHCYGDHLHFETRINGTPVNPAGYL